MKDITMIICTLLAKITSILILCLLLYLSVLNSKVEDFSQHQVSDSIKDSLERGAFIKKAVVIPDKIHRNNHTIHIVEAWIERRIKIKYRFGFFKKKQYLKDMVFCLRFDRTDFLGFFKWKFVVARTGGLMSRRRSFYNEKTQKNEDVVDINMKNIVFDINEDNQATFHVSVTRDFKKQNKELLVITGLDRHSPYIENIKGK
ncbi:hypothetical protein EPICR_10221 [Candidatus Desulfarcum epimagneticum]|uniref:Uncharacterized protein n=1 Tax=uncultured Desulfobacteraceae bacterium TaxID=218296 RepID=A0A484HC16_9BACT|nr:hypothetical protein EPICR_10221 [uncultured Desulfobacteraceae bacterium]